MSETPLPVESGSFTKEFGLDPEFIDTREQDGTESALLTRIGGYSEALDVSIHTEMSAGSESSRWLGKKKSSENRS